MDSPALLIIAAAVLAYGLVSRGLQRASLTAPMIFTALGFLIGGAVLDLIEIDIATHQIKLVAELTLILVLFADAAGVDLRLLRADEAVPARMLAIGLPLAVLLGTGAALLLLPGLGLWEAALLATLLAPTDAALARPVIVEETVPLRIRQTVNAESGLNDGLALPLVFVFLALAMPGGEDRGVAGWLGFSAAQVLGGAVIGIATGWVGGKAVERAVRHHEMEPVFQRLSAVALALIAYVGASLTGGNGFIAAFAAGGAFGYSAQRSRGEVTRFGETEGQLLALLTFLAFGIALLPQALAGFSWAGLGFAVVSLCLVRPVAIALSLTGTGLTWSSRLFLGWFGPRGLASIVFAMIIEAEMGAERAAPLMAVAALTIGLSILLHGASARPLSHLYARHLNARGDADALKEFAQVEHGSDLGRKRH